MPSAYWDAQTAPFNTGIRSIGQALMQRPYMQAMANQRAAMSQFYQAHAGQEEAAAEEARARTTKLGVDTQRGQLQLSSALALADRFKQPGAITQDKEGNLVIDKAAIGDVVSAISGESKDATDASTSIAGLLKGRNEPVQADLNRAKPVVVPTGGTLINPQTGQPIAEGGVTLPPGATRFAPQIASALPMTKTATGAPVAPKSSAVDNTIASAIAKTVLANNSDASGVITNTPANVGNQLSSALAPFLKTGTATATPGMQPGPQHIAYLMAHPDTAQMFDAKFGQGASAQFLKSAQTPQALPAIGQ